MRKRAKPKTILICVSGGSGSGKTTVAKTISQNLPKNLKTQIVCQDNYYLPFDDKSLAQRRKINFDHPDSFDWNLLINQIKDLLNRKSIDIPVYDYKNYTRSKKTIKARPANVIIFEGITTFYCPEIEKLASLKIFVDTPSDERLSRRIERDTLQRNRSLKSIIKQWRKTVRPMYREYIEPQKLRADLIIPWYTINEVAMQAITGAINDFFKK